MVGCLSINSLSRCFALQILLEIVLVGLSLPRPPLRGGRGAISPDYFLQENLSRFLSSSLSFITNYRIILGIELQHNQFFNSQILDNKYRLSLYLPLF